MATHTLDVAQFRTDFPFFASTTDYPNSTIEIAWKRAAFAVLPTDNCLVSDDRLQYLLELVTAHYSYIIRQGQIDPAFGATATGGVVNSATEGSVSAAFQTPTVKNFWEYQFSQTEWGREFIAIVQTLVLGGFTIGGKPEGAAIRDVYGLF